MAAKIYEFVTGAPGDVHSSQQNQIGRIAKGEDSAGNFAEYIYLQGVASCAIGTWVTYDEDFVTTRTAANAQGNVAVATAAVDATTEYGWFQITGLASALALTAFADNGKVYLTSTAGSVDDTDVGQDFVVGAIGRSAVNETTLLADFQLNRPHVQDTAYD
jgi:hypothetical protein